MKQTFNGIIPISKITFYQIVQDRILYSVVFIAIFLFFLSYLGSLLSFVNPDRIVLDFGMTTLNIACAFIAILFGANLLPKEYENRTIHLILCRPVRYWQFLIGKSIGLNLVIALNWGLLLIGYLVIFYISGGKFYDLNFFATFFCGALFAFFQATILMSSAIFFSTITTKSLSVLFSVGLFLVGNNISQLNFLQQKTTSPYLALFWEWIARLLPNLESLSVGIRLTYGIDIPIVHFFNGFFQTLFYSILFCSLSVLVLKVREN